MPHDCSVVITLFKTRHVLGSEEPRAEFAIEI
jgi:hypothetical protein